MATATTAEFMAAVRTNGCARAALAAARAGGWGWGDVCVCVWGGPRRPTSPPLSRSARAVALLDGGLVSASCLDEPDSGGDTALLTALRNCDGALVAALLRHGADPRRGSLAGRLPLVRACAAHDPGLLRSLVARGADPRASERVSGKTVLHTGAAAGAELAAAALELGCPVGAVDARGRTALFDALGGPAGGRADVLAVLLGAGADVNARDATGLTPLSAVLNDRELAPLAAPDPPLIETLVAAGADPRAVDVHGRSPLSGAVCGPWRPRSVAGGCDAARAAMVACLLRHGASARDAGPGGVPITHLAVASAGAATLRALLRGDADAQAVDGNGGTLAAAIAASHHPGAERNECVTELARALAEGGAGRRLDDSTPPPKPLVVPAPGAVAPGERDGAAVAVAAGAVGAGVARAIVVDLGSEQEEEEQGAAAGAARPGGPPPAPPVPAAATPTRVARGAGRAVGPPPPVEAQARGAAAAGAGPGPAVPHAAAAERPSPRAPADRVVPVVLLDGDSTDEADGGDGDDSSGMGYLGASRSPPTVTVSSAALSSPPSPPAGDDKPPVSRLGSRGHDGVPQAGPGLPAAAAALRSAGSMSDVLLATRQSMEEVDRRMRTLHTTIAPGARPIGQLAPPPPPPAADARPAAGDGAGLAPRRRSMKAVGGVVIAARARGKGVEGAAEGYLSWPDATSGVVSVAGSARACVRACM